MSTGFDRRPAGGAAGPPAAPSVLVATVVAAAVAVALAPAPVAAGPLDWIDPVRARNREGNDAYRQGSFEEAAKRYSEGSALDPARPELRYNLGNALEQMGMHEESVASYESLLEAGAGELAASTWYNLGNSRLEGGDAAGAVEAYRGALLADPTHGGAKRNLELALEKMEEQPKPEPESSEEDDQGDREGEPQPRPSQQPPPEGEGERPRSPRPRPDEMSEDEAERLLRSFEQKEREQLRDRDEREAYAAPGGLDW